jgi:hypothetical protein
MNGHIVAAVVGVVGVVARRRHAISLLARNRI